MTFNCFVQQVRSMTLLLEESRKEARWVRDRNQELERVVEALRKTIMRQADLSSQRQDQPGGVPAVVRDKVYFAWLRYRCTAFVC